MKKYIEKLKINTTTEKIKLWSQHGFIIGDFKKILKMDGLYSPVPELKIKKLIVNKKYVSVGSVDCKSIFIDSLSGHIFIDGVPLKKENTYKYLNFFGVGNWSDMNLKFSTQNKLHGNISFHTHNLITCELQEFCKQLTLEF